MGRKVKYKDVVKKGPPHFAKKGLKGKKSFKHGKDKQKPYINHKTNKSFKRKPDYDGESSNLKKRPKPDIEKVEEEKLTERFPSESESDEDIYVDPMTQLRASFGIKLSDKPIDTDSSSEGEDEVEEEEDDNLNNESEPDEEPHDSAVEADSDSNLELDSEGEESDDCKIENNIKPQQANIPEKDELDIDQQEDPFVKHVSYELHPSLLETLESKPESLELHTKCWPKLGNLIVQIPKYEIKENIMKTKLDTTVYALPSPVPSIIGSSESPKNLCIKSQIIPNLTKANQSIVKKETIFTPLQREIFSIINNYQDLYYPERTFDNAEEIRFVYCLHVVNHVLKSRTKVVHHNSKLSKRDDVPEEFRDQGLVRPKVLIVAPFKDSAYKIITTIISILFKEDKGGCVQKKDKFIEEYTGHELYFPKKNPKPEDYENLFAGNTSDDFRIGMSITKKSLKLYTDFYSSDIIVASPLGLRTIIKAEGEPDRDFDFLTSIELLIMDQTDVFLMQNWHHVIHFFNHMHLKPKDLHGTDVSRVRQWCLNLWAKYYRQTLIFSSVTLPLINSLFNKCVNFAGRVKVSNPKQVDMSRVFVKLPHVFHKFNSTSPSDDVEKRFGFFTQNILARQKDVSMKQTLIYIPSYYDYVKVRNYFMRENIEFVPICEYFEKDKVAKARDLFYHGDVHFMLYTERYHFYHRIRIKGIRHLVFYQPPSFPDFYYEMSNLMTEANMNRKVGSRYNMSVTVIYSKYDVLQLAPIVGTDTAAKMVESDRDVHMMFTGTD